MTLRPDSQGRIAGYIFAGSTAMLTQTAGAAQQFGRYALAPSTATGFGTMSFVQSASGTFNWGLTPLQEILYNEFRPLGLHAKFTFTGSSMMNGGALVARRATPATGSRSIVTASGDRTVPVRFSPDPKTNYRLLNSAAHTAAARSGFSVALYPSHRLYEPVGHLANNVVVGPVGVAIPTPGEYGEAYDVIHTSMPCVYFEYTGLDSSASITVDLSMCVQNAIDPNTGHTLMPYAAASPNGNPSILDSVLGFLNSKPVIYAGEYATAAVTSAAMTYLNSLTSRALHN